MPTISPSAAAVLRRAHEQLASGLKVNLQTMLATLDSLIDIANQLSSQAPEFRPSPAQLKIFEAMRGGRKMSRKQVEALRGVGRRAYNGPGSLGELLELGLADVKAGRFELTEPGEAMASEWLDEDSTDDEDER